MLLSFITDTGFGTGAVCERGRSIDGKPPFNCGGGDDDNDYDDELISTKHIRKYLSVSKILSI